MRAFNAIIATAADRKGGLTNVETILRETPVLEPAVIAATPDDRILAAMTRRIFSAGFSSKVIEAKWPAFEAAFDAFDPRTCAFITPDRFDALLQERGIVRNGVKIRSVLLNAQFLLDLAAEHGSAARFFANWPDTDYVGLLAILKRRGNHLGGDSGMRFLRSIGKPAIIFTKDVVAALIREGVLDRSPSARRDFAAIQQACNQWSEQSGRNLTEISRILAMTVATSAHDEAEEPGT